MPLQPLCLLETDCVTTLACVGRPTCLVLNSSVRVRCKHNDMPDERR